MVATYDEGLADPVSQVRFHLGDTDPCKALIQDETILALLVSKSVLGAASAAAYSISAHYARLGDVTVDDQRNVYSKITQQFKELGDRLKFEASNESSSGRSGFSGVMVGGIGDCRGPLDNPCCDPVYGVTNRNLFS